MPEIDDLVNYTILIAVAVAIILFFTGKFIDMSLERQLATQSRATINLLQTIVTQSDILVQDSGGNKMKLAVDRNRYDGADFSGCCGSVQYDYKFSVGDEVEKLPNGFKIKSTFPTKYNFEPGGWDRFDIDSFCYTAFTLGASSGADVPVNICDGGLESCSQGLAHIETRNTPLSEMTYWITQACNAESGLSKRIPLSQNDYNSPDDIALDAENKKICLGGVCKKYSCESVPVVAEAGDPKELIDQEIPGSPLNLVKCNFAKIVRDGKVVKVVGGMETVVPAPEEEAYFFLPFDQNAWTEDYKTHVLATPPEYPIELGIDGVPAKKGSRYLALTKAQGRSVGDVGMLMGISQIEEDLDACEVVNKDGTKSSVKCVNMLERGLTEIKFDARMHFTGDGEHAGLLTWKLIDEDGTCIQKNYGLLGFGKDDVVSGDWTEYTIRVADAEKNYGGCVTEGLGTFDPFTDFLNKVGSSFEKALGNRPYPKDDFSWNVIAIEFDACDKSVLGFTCAKLIDNMDALMIDKFYFRGVKKQ